MSDTRLYIVRAELDRARLFALARRHRLPPRHVDLGYMIHCALRASFGEHAPQPFSFDDRAHALTLLGYAQEPSETLREYARAIEDDAVRSMWRGAALTSKPMPTEFAAGARLRFSVRICPVLRKASAGEKHRKGAEVDVFLARGWEAGAERRIDREATYRTWLAERLAANGAATVFSAAMVEYRRERVVRSTHANGDGPRVRHCERPDAQFQGILQIDHAGAFAALLRRGVGRHRAFGFGMLLLRPLGAGGC